MRIATAPVNWNSPDVPEYRAWLPYRQMMDEFVEAGYDATEWGPGMPEDPVELKEALDARGLDMVGAFVGLGFRDADRYDAEMARAMEIAHRLHATGGRLLIAAEGGDDRRRGEAGHVVEANGLTDVQWKNLAPGLHDLADNLAPLGMKVVFHNHVGTYVETPGETARLLDETDPAKVGWCLDIGHLAYGGGNSLEMLGIVRGPGGAHPPQGRRWGCPGTGQGRGLELRHGAQELHLPGARRGNGAGPRGGGGPAGARLRRLVRPGAGHHARTIRRTWRGPTGSTWRRCWPGPGRADGRRGRRPSPMSAAERHAGRHCPRQTWRRSPGAGASWSSRPSPTAGPATWVARCRRWISSSRSTSASCGSAPTSRTGRSGTGSSCPRATAPWPCTR